MESLSQNSLMTRERSLVSIDVFRGVAALWVVAYHSKATPNAFSMSRPVESLLALPIQLGYLGVTLFLVISGFCIHLKGALQPLCLGSLAEVTS